MGLMLLISSCAFVNRNVDLTYEKIVNAGGGSGIVFVAKPVEVHNLPKNPEGLLIVGSANPVAHIEGLTGSILIPDNIGNWVVDALRQELSTSGYTVKPVLTLPRNTTKGLEVTVLGINDKLKTGFFSATLSVDLQFSVEIFKNGNKIKSLKTSGRGEEATSTLSASVWGSCLRKALQNAMQQVIPQIIKTLEE
jgi:hypothetical protein